MMYQVGDIVVASITNALENPKATGKPSPVVLVREQGGHWLVSGLTRLNTYSNGIPRVAVASSLTTGLRHPSFLWGPRLARVSKIDLHQKIGRINRECADQIITLSSLHGSWADDLRASSQDASTFASTAHIPGLHLQSAEPAPSDSLNGDTSFRPGFTGKQVVGVIAGGAITAAVAVIVTLAVTHHVAVAENLLAYTNGWSDGFSACAELI